MNLDGSIQSGTIASWIRVKRWVIGRDGGYLTTLLNKVLKST